MRRRPDAFTVAAWLAFSLLVAPPLLWLLASAIPAAITAATRGAFLSGREWMLLGKSIRLAVEAALIAILLGAVVGLALARLRPWQGRALLSLTLVTLSLPPYVTAIAWNDLRARGGPLAVVLRQERPMTEPAPVPEIDTVAAVQAAMLWPVVALLLYRALRFAATELEDAARLETSAWRAFWCAHGPAARTALATGGILVFVLVLSDASVPGTMGVATYPVEIQSRFQAEADMGAAVLLALPLLALLLPLVRLQLALIDAAPPVADGAVVGRPRSLPRFLSLGACAVAWLIAIITTAPPLAALFRESLPVASYLAVIREAGDAAPLTIGLALVAATVTTGVALLVVLGARVGARFRVPFAWLALAPYTLPGSLIAIALIALLNRPGPLGDLYASIWVLPLAYVARFFPFAHRTVADGAARVGPELWDAARVDGASTVAIVCRIVTPLIRSHLAVAFALVFILAGRELDATALLRPPDGDTLGFRVHDLYHYGPSRQVAALGVLLAGLTSIVAVVVTRLVDRERG